MAVKASSERTRASSSKNEENRRTERTTALTKVSKRKQTASPSPQSRARRRLDPSQQVQSASAMQVQRRRARRATRDSEFDASLPLRNWWLCGERSCPHYQYYGSCYRQDLNSGSYNHLPLTDEIALKWTTEIEAGRLTISAPSSMILGMLRRARRELDFAKKMTDCKRTIAAGPIQINVFCDADTYLADSRYAVPVTINIFNGIDPEKFFRWQQGPFHTLPPPAPSSLESLACPPIEQFEQFFSWCMQQPTWRGDEQEIANLSYQWDENGYGLDGIYACSMREWKDMGLQPDQLEKIKNSVREFVREGARYAFL